METHLIPSVPPSIYYLPNFLTPEETSRILAKIPQNRWITLSHRRLQALPSRLTPNNTLVASSALPSWLISPVVERIHSLGIFASSPHAGINHCLVNEYLPGQGIMAHEDGAAYHPVVATVSLGGSLVLDVREKGGGEGGGDEEEGKKTWRILQEPGSLLVTTGGAYEETLHGIAEVEVDEDLREETVANWGLLGDREKIVEGGGRNVRGTRVSLTFRDVRKVSSVAGKIFGKIRG